MQPKPTPQQNHLLNALPNSAIRRLLPHLELVSLSLGQILYDSGDMMDHAYFPTDCIVSLLQIMENGASGEIAVVGNEGLIGIAVFMGGVSTPSQALVQNAGSAFRIPAQKLRDEFNRHDRMMQLLLCYIQSLIVQMSQTAVCNKHHPIDQQLCRWLLLSLDRLENNDKLTMNESLICHMLGVDADAVSTAAGRLQAQGVINYDDGHIIVVDRPKLETLSCECYAVVREEANRLCPYLPISLRPDRE